MNILIKGTVAQTAAIRAGIKIVRDVLAKHDLSKGLSTAELYRLTLREPAPEGFKGDPRLTNEPGGIKGITLPPQNDHPIRSKAFLKNSILTALVGSQEIVKVTSTREITEPIPVVKKGRVKSRPTPESVGASPTTPVTIKAWVWKPMTEEIRQAQTRKRIPRSTRDRLNN